jgi:hypothetical protein
MVRCSLSVFVIRGLKAVRTVLAYFMEIDSPFMEN